MHGVCQIIEKMLNQQKCNYGWFGKSIKIIVTFLIVNFAWIFFRMPTLGDAFGVIGHIFDFTQPMTVEINSKPILAFIVMGTSILFMKDWFDEFAPSRLQLFNNKRAVVRWTAYVVVMVMILLSGVFDAGQFIYANF